MSLFALAHILTDLSTGAGEAVFWQPQSEAIIRHEAGGLGKVSHAGHWKVPQTDELRVLLWMPWGKKPFTNVKWCAVRLCESTIFVWGRTCLCWSSQHSSGQGSRARKGSTLGSPEFRDSREGSGQWRCYSGGPSSFPGFYFSVFFPFAMLLLLTRAIFCPPHSHAFFPVWFWYKGRQK